MQQAVWAPDYRRRVTLLNGEEIVIRPVSPGDRASLRILFDRLGPETRFLRFQYAKTNMSEEELGSYCDCDYDITFTLVAEMVRSGSTDIVGVGRYDRLANPESAEVAFVVEDKEQGNGIGTHLLRELALVAKPRGLKRFVAETVTYNEIMLSIFRKFDRRLKTQIDGESCLCTFSVNGDSVLASRQETA